MRSEKSVKSEIRDFRSVIIPIDGAPCLALGSVWRRLVRWSVAAPVRRRVESVSRQTGPPLPPQVAGYAWCGAAVAPN